MGSFVSYIMISAVALLALWIVYRWLLADECQHSFNRAILLSAYGVSLVFPAVAAIRLGGAGNGGTVALGQITATLAGVQPEASQAVRWPVVVVAVYFAGVAVMILLTAVTWIRLSRIVARGERRTVGGYTLVLTGDTTLSPFSWLGYIVMSRADYESDGGVIVAHELKHLSLGHPADMIVAQAFVIAQWFNPAAWLMRNELRSVHEYQADMAVLDSGFNARDYQMLLIKKAVGRKFPSLANSLNHSKLKKRITMMLNSKKTSGRRVRALAMVPALAVALVAVNLPFVSNAMSDLDGVSMPGKDTKKSPDYTVSAVVGDLISVETVPMPSDGITTEIVSAGKSGDKPEKANVIGVTVESIKNGDVEVIVDGVKVGSLDDIDRSRIKSITVIKDQRPAKIIIATNDAGDGEPSLAMTSEPIEVVGYGTKTKDNHVYDAVEEMPRFPGGEEALMRHLAMNIRFPQSETGADKPQSRRVIVRFIIDKEGHVSDPEIVRSGGEALDAEARRVVMTIPDFIPGKINGEPVATTYTLPVVFRKN